MKKIKAWVLISLFAIITIADLVLTRTATPNLKNEANPLVRILGFGWFGLIAVNIIVLLIYAALVYYAFVVYKKPDVTAATAKEYRKKLDEKSGFRNIPAMVGFSLSYSMIIARLIPVIDWLQILRIFTVPSFTNFRAFIPHRRPDLVIAMVLAVVSAVVWMIKYYRFVPKPLAGENL